MLGLFGIFGRSHELQRLDQALRGVGRNPRLVPEAVKLTTLKLLGEAGAAGRSPQRPRPAVEPAALADTPGTAGSLVLRRMDQAS